MPKGNSLPKLQESARQIRISIVKMLNAAGSGHTGGAMGIADVLTALYFSVMDVDPDKPDRQGRDRFVLSAAHMVPALYATLAERGFFLKKELSSLRSFGSRLKGHTMRNPEIGIETTGGSLGQGISIAVGFALAARLKQQNWRTYCVIGDGECDEGEVWEAAMLAAKEKLDNLCVILDRNHIQLSANTQDVMPLEPLAAKWEAFGWHVTTVDGNDMAQVLFAFEKAKLVKSQPVIIIANTVPGKGVSFMENKWEWHGKVPGDAELAKALSELESTGE
ncbi:transketolase [Candidatus Dojkabacteria bacterium]|uniref:Transketolase n=1 Tax=Candidatus Dojkabacteria bacterium TaxID=2099670 RepID=A0A955ID61_9BACT|nr:transketolase [Candidatus Dojkabacteria bacterium]